MSPADFRKELVKHMPGYKWTIHQSSCPESYLRATGIQSSGFNRLSTLQVERRDNYAGGGKPRYEAKSAGYGRKAPWLHVAVGLTLAQALRSLQDHYETVASQHGCHASAMQVGRGRGGRHSTLGDWLPPETAPRDGSVILADTGYPWPVLAVWSDFAESWVTTELQASVCNDLNDPAWVTEGELRLRGWMVLPSTRAAEGVE